MHQTSNRGLIEIRQLLQRGWGWYRRQSKRWQQPNSMTAYASESMALAGLADRRPRRRWEAAGVLARNPLGSREAIAALSQSLADPEPFVRWQAAEALAAQEAGTVFPVLRALLRDDNPLYRAGAAEALGQMGGEAACVELRQALLADEPEPDVRVALARALGCCNDPTAAQALLPLVDDPAPEVRCAAAQALGRLGDPRLAAVLAEALAQPGQPLLVRRALSAALVHIAHPEVQATLLQALRDPDAQVRAYAAEALGQVGNEEAMSLLAAARQDDSPLLRGRVSDVAARAISSLERRGRQSPPTPGPATGTADAAPAADDRAG